MIGVAPPAYDPAAPQDGGTPARRPAARPCAPMCANCSAGTAGPSAADRGERGGRAAPRWSGPYLLGGLVEELSHGRRASSIWSVRRRGCSCSRSLVQTVFVRLVRLRGAMLGEEMLADLREDFLVRSVGLPPGVLERAGTGDLLSRITTDIDRLANAMREAVPQLAIGVVWAALLLGGLVVTAPPLALAVLVAAAAAGGRLPLVLPAGAVGVPLGGRRVRGGGRRARRDRGRRAGPSRRTASATAGSSCRDRRIRRVDRLGAVHALAADRCSSRSSTSPTYGPLARC